MNTYTVWIRDANGEGTTHISAHEAATAGEAEALALAETADDWNYDPARADVMLCVIGVAEGDVKIVHWED